MRCRLLWSGTAAAGIAVGMMWAFTTPVAGQGAPAGNRAGVSAPANWTPPRTPWGDPDLQGNYTNTYENGTPLERPELFAGRRLEDITQEELLKQRAAIQARTVGNFQGPIHAPDHWWQDNLNLDRGSQAWLIIDPPDGKIPALTPEAQRRIAAATDARRKNTRGPADSYTDRSLYDRCITRGVPGSMMPSIYGNSHEFVQSPGFVVIRSEMIHEARVVPLDGRPRPTRPIPQDMGTSRGWWEGNTLVVETVGFKARSVFRNANPDTLVLTERFTRVNPRQVRWEVKVEDPSTWTKPWTFALPLTVDDVPLPAYDCHEGNYAMPNILSAARAEEREAARTGRAVVNEGGVDPQSSAPAEGR
jgi:hypothetical protein